MRKKKEQSEKTQFINQCLVSGKILKQEIISGLQTKFGIKKSAAYNYLNRWYTKEGAEKCNNTVLLKEEQQKTCIIAQNCTFTKPIGKRENTIKLLVEKYNLLTENGVIPTQKSISAESGLSIRTVKVYWAEILSGSKKEINLKKK